MREVELEAQKGETFELNVKYTDDEDNAVNLTGYTARLDTSAPGLTPASYSATVDASGNIVVKVPHTVTADWPHFTNYRLVLTTPDADVKYILSGAIAAKDWDK